MHFRGNAPDNINIYKYPTLYHFRVSCLIILEPNLGAKLGQQDKDKHLFRGIATHRKISLLSDDTGYYYKDVPGPSPDTAPDGVTIDTLEKLYQINPLVNKAINLKVNRVIGMGFDLIPADDVDVVLADQAVKDCWEFLKRINYQTFFKQSLINAHVAGNEFTELLYNQLGALVSVSHGDFKSIDFRRDYVNNKILLDGEGIPVGYWQYINDLSQLYRNLSLLYGSIPSYENLQAAKERLQETQSHIIYNEAGQPIGSIAYKANYMFLRKDEIVHLALNRVNDNWYGFSTILPAYDAITQLNQVMFATAEAINTIGYPKPVMYVGDKDHPPTDDLNDMAQDAVTDPVRKESFVLPYYARLEYLKSDSASQLSQYPQWYITAVSVGLRVPRELLTGEGDSNRASAYQQGSDFEKDCEAERRYLEEYVYEILDKYLQTHGYITNDGSRCPYIPQIKWVQLITEDQINRERMVLEKWNAGLITFNEARQLLELNEVEDPSIGERYSSEREVSPPTMPATDVQSDIPPIMEAQHALVAGINPKLNKQLGTENVNMKMIVEKKLGKKIKSVSKAKAKKIIEKIVNAEATKTPAKQIISQVQKIGNYTEDKARRLLVTEQNNLRQEAHLEQAKKDGMKFKKWVSNEEACPICKSLNGKSVPLSANFEAEYEGKKYKTKAPAIHPDCNCSLAFSETAKFGKEYPSDGKAPKGFELKEGPRGGEYYETNPDEESLLNPKRKKYLFQIEDAPHSDNYARIVKELTPEQKDRMGKCHEKALEYAEKHNWNFYTFGYDHSVASDGKYVYDFVIDPENLILLEDYEKKMKLPFTQESFEDVREFLKGGKKS